MNWIPDQRQLIISSHKDSNAYLACQKFTPRVIVMTNAFLAQTVLLLRAEHQSLGGVDGCHNSVEGGRSGMVAEGEGGTCYNGGKVDLPRSDAGGIKPGRISLRGRPGRRFSKDRIEMQLSYSFCAESCQASVILRALRHPWIDLTPINQFHACFGASPFGQKQWLQVMLLLPVRKLAGWL